MTARALTLLGACAWPVAVVAGVTLQAPGVLMMAVLLGLLVLGGLVAALPRRHYVLGLFVAAFAMFLLSRHLINLFWPGTTVLRSRLIQWTPDLETHVLLCLNLALLGLGLGAVLAGHALARRELGQHAIPAPSAADRERREAVVASVRQVGLLLLAVTVPARLLYVLDTASFVQEAGFYELYVSDRQTTSLPGPIVTLADMSDVAVMAVLATRPGRRLTWLALGLYFLDGLTTLTTLTRGTFFLNTLLIVVYLIYRHTTRAPGEAPWLRPWPAVAALAVVPALATLSRTLDEARGRASVSEFGGPIRNFAHGQGVSVNVIAFSEQFDAQIPDGRWYSFGPIIEFVRFRVLGLVTGERPWTGNTVERALDGHLFSHTVSYLAIPDVYTRGSGYGSSYVAELYVDLGYPGVLLGSVLIGALTVLLTGMLGWGLVPRLLALLMIRQLFFIPRGSVTGFLVNAFDVQNLMALAALAAGAWLLISHRARGDRATARLSSTSRRRTPERVAR